MSEQQPEPTQPEPAQPDDQAEHGEQEGVTPRIWVGSLLDYNHGVLHGDWLDAAREAEEIHADIQTMLAASPTARQTGEPAEEWGIFDYEGFGPLRVDQHESVEVVGRIARGVAEHGLAYAAYADVMDADPDVMAGFADSYRGHYASVEAYAEQLVDELGYQQLIDAAVPESFRRYVHIDVAALAHDMQFSGELYVYRADDGGVWIFTE
jgi:antirestriction protein